MAYTAGPRRQGAEAPTQEWGRAPVQPQVVYVAQPQQTSVERLSVPLILFFSALFFIGWATWFGTSSINAIQSEIKSITVSLENYMIKQDERVARIEEGLAVRTAERWTRTDHELFCARTEAIPGNKGWRCAKTSTAGFSRIDDPPIWQGAPGHSAHVADVEIGDGAWPKPKIKKVTP